MAEQTVMTASEYSDSVREWLMQAYQWHALAYSESTILNSKGRF